MLQPPHPTLFQLPTRVWLHALGERLGRPATLADAPEADLEAWATAGFDWIWPLGVWRIGPAVRSAALANRPLRQQLAALLPGLADNDIVGSCFAIDGYVVDPALGGDEALAQLRERLHQHGLRLLVDFIPNHVGLGHPWLAEHPEWFIHGTSTDLALAPHNWTRVAGAEGELILAHGRDPFFPGWSDTLQLDYSQPALVAAMTAELAGVARRCDGVRCDMAMLVLPEVFQHTWGRYALPFWPAAIASVRAAQREFFFLAEVYWDLEAQLLAEGFDACYDKPLYDALHGSAPAVRARLFASAEVQDRLVRFLENHDEARAAAAFPPGRHEAAAVLSYLAPGVRLFQRGQREGHRIRLPVQLRRGPAEPVDLLSAAFYDGLWAVLGDLALRQGSWCLLPVGPAHPDEATWRDVLAWTWVHPDAGTRLVVVNFAPHASHALIGWPAASPDEQPQRLVWQPLWPDPSLSAVAIHPTGHGLTVELGPWGYGLFAVSA
jgi:hypothetical protein